ncbi:MAG: hypothetical protein H5T62_10280 [Anaerolineae bacterium]|nr:hypothetical protein [Anaerolineae bacterium]
MLKRVVLTLLLLLVLVIIGCLQSPGQSATAPLSPTPQSILQGTSESGEMALNLSEL